MTRPHSVCTAPLCRRKGEPSHTPKRGNGHDPIPDHAGSAHFWEKTGMTPPHSGNTNSLPTSVGIYSFKKFCFFEKN